MWRKVDCIWQPEMTNSGVGLRRRSKALPRVSLVPRKGHGHFGGLLPVWSTAAFWIPAKPLQLRSMLCKSMRHSKNINACSWPWSTERIQFFSTTMPDHTLHDQCFRSWTNWATKFCPSAIFTWPLTNKLPLLPASRQLFAGTTFLQPGCRKMLSKSSSNSEAQIFML